VYACVAEEIQWPLAKDETAVKVDDSHYFFSFRVPKGSDPGEEEEDVLSYGLTIASKGQEGLLKEPIWLRVEPKTEAKRPGSMASGSIEPRQKGPLWLRFLTEAKSYVLLASPQYASVLEPMQNIKNNRCQRPFLHWCFQESLSQV